MVHEYWLRVAQLFGMAWRGLAGRAQNLLIVREVVVTAFAADVLRRWFAPIIDIVLPSGDVPLSTALIALGILLYYRAKVDSKG